MDRVAVVSLQHMLWYSVTFFFHLYSALTVLRIRKKEFGNGVKPQSKNGISEDFTLLRTLRKTAEYLGVTKSLTKFAVF
jgi:hypothetical protein